MKIIAISLNPSILRVYEFIKDIANYILEFDICRRNAKFATR